MGILADLHMTKCGLFCLDCVWLWLESPCPTDRYMCNELGMCEGLGPISHNNEQTQSVKI